ncbi:MAG: Crp/Fnr family transcriptional regulator [Acidobacteria bacterium]|nr:Crp/Fnr family transcriptional regulator [Acidobacteriota bacterium]
MLDLELLRRVGFFSALEAKDLAAIRDVAEVRAFPKGKLLFCEGDRGDSFYLVLKGKVKATLLAEDGREVILSLLGPGEIVGEMALFDAEERRSATVETIEDSELLVLSGQAFLDVMAARPGIAMSVIATLAQRLRETSCRIRNLIFLDTYSRVGRYLVELARKQGRELADGSLLVLRPTHQEIANYIGTTRETVSRSMHELQAQGLIKIVGRRVILYRVNASGASPRPCTAGRRL